MSPRICVVRGGEIGEKRGARLTAGPLDQTESLELSSSSCRAFEADVPDTTNGTAMDCIYWPISLGG